MLTVIIAEQHIIEQYEQNKALLTPFDDQKIVFCRWNCEGGSIEEMLPDLKDIISFNVNWRAVIVTDKNKEQINPYDVVDYTKYINDNGKVGFDETLIQKCQSMYECYDQSKLNPLTQLSAALCELPYYAETIKADAYELLGSKTALLQYIFKSQFETTNSRKLVADIRKYYPEQMLAFVDGKNCEVFLEALSNKDYDTIFSLLPEDKFMKFLGFAKIGNSAIYDPGYWYALFESTKKTEIYNKLKSAFTLRIPLPQEVLCVAMRNFDMRLHNSRVMWSDNHEQDYTDFVRYNLYNENIRFLVYDVPDEFETNVTAVLKFHILLQVLAMNGNAASSISKNKVFQVDMEYDRREFNKTIARLIARLRATALQINEDIFVLRSKKLPDLDNKTARLIFENDVKIHVQTDKEYDKKTLMASYDDVGLARDCPTEELPYWDDQYNGIRKHFKRFLREPRRAIKKACTNDFKDNNKINDIRAIALNENQREDIIIKLEEEEQNMVSTVTTAIYNTSKYYEAMEDADKVIRRGISQRITKKKAVIGGLIALLAYFIGFLPLIFGNLNNLKSFSFAIYMIACVLGIFLICGFICLIVFRKRQVDRYKHFNYVMSGICSDIRNSLDTFSKYLSHACMVMREKSVLNMANSHETEDESKARVLEYNRIELEKLIEHHYKLLSDFSDEDVDTLLSMSEKEQILPFGYDYTKQEEHSYPIFGETNHKDIEYMLSGHMVSTPMLCVEKVILKREELYD